MKTNLKFVRITLLLSILSLIGTCFIYTSLPQEIAIHFNIAGEPDDFSHRSFIFITAFLPFLMLGLFKVLPKIDPKKQSYEKHVHAFSILSILLTVFFILIHWSMIFIALGYNLSINTLITFLVGILFIIIGNYMPQIRQNYTFGIRLPWTLEDTDNWRYTHRIGGYSFLFAGFIILVSVFFSSTVQFTLLMISVACTLIIPGTASYLYYRKHQRR